MNILSRITKYHADISKPKKDGGFSKIDKIDFDIFMKTLIDTICTDTIGKPFDNYCEDDRERDVISECWKRVIKEGIDFMKGHITHMRIDKDKSRDKVSPG